MDRIGNDLTLKLDNGDVARIKGFFEENQDGKKNRLFFGMLLLSDYHLEFFLQRPLI